MKKQKRISKISLLIGGITAVLLVCSTLVFSRAEQCPQNYTQQQVDSAKCIVGANIGFGVILVAAVVVLIVSAAIAILSNRKK